MDQESFVHLRTRIWPPAARRRGAERPLKSKEEESGRSSRTCSALALGAAFAATAAHAQAQAEIKVSYQPALYWSLPFYVASEKVVGEVGLKPVFSTFPAGVPQIAASASKSWDVGGRTGSVPAVLGAALQQPPHDRPYQRRVGRQRAHGEGARPTRSSRTRSRSRARRSC